MLSPAVLTSAARRASLMPSLPHSSIEGPNSALKRGCILPERDTVLMLSLFIETFWRRAVRFAPRLRNWMRFSTVRSMSCR